MKRSPELNSWYGMKNRCSNPKSSAWSNYGGRGIAVCQRWAESFNNFLADMGPKPSPKHSIDRYPNNDGNYEPGNCRWATQAEQRANQRPPIRPGGNRPQPFRQMHIARALRAAMAVGVPNPTVEVHLPSGAMLVISGTAAT